MPAPFSQTMRARHAARPAWTGLALTVLLLIAWAIWFFGSRVSVYAVSYAARLEIEKGAGTSFAGTHLFTRAGFTWFYLKQKILYLRAT